MSHSTLGLQLLGAGIIDLPCESLSRISAGPCLQKAPPKAKRPHDRSVHLNLRCQLTSQCLAAGVDELLHPSASIPESQQFAMAAQAGQVEAAAEETGAVAPHHLMRHGEVRISSLL